MSKKPVPLLALLFALGLSACGMKAGLNYRPGPVPEPLLGNPKPEPKKTEPEKAEKDLSTVKESNR